MTAVPCPMFGELELDRLLRSVITYPTGSENEMDIALGPFCAD
jgi:hypothetical protein